MKQRFSKDTVRQVIEKRINKIGSEWGFDPSNGTAQLAKYPHRPKHSEACSAYGEWQGLWDLVEELDL